MSGCSTQTPNEDCDGRLTQTWIFAADADGVAGLCCDYCTKAGARVWQMDPDLTCRCLDWPADGPEGFIQHGWGGGMRSRYISAMGFIARLTLVASGGQV